MSGQVRAPPAERLSPDDSRATAPGLLFEDGLLLSSAIGVQLQPPLCRELIFPDGLCLGDIGQELLLEGVSHNVKFSGSSDLSMGEAGLSVGVLIKE